MSVNAAANPGKSFWIVSILALVWNLLGVLTYLMTVMMTPEMLATLPEGERALLENTPAWVTGAYAIAVFAGTLGCIGLLVRRAWSIPVLAISLLAIVVQMGYSVLGTALLEVRGPGGVIMPLIIIVVGAYLVLFARKAKAKSWLR